jgi:hypothetical protein
MAGMDHPGLKTKFAWGGAVRHPGTLSEAAGHPSKMRVAQIGRAGMLETQRGRIGFDWSMVMPAAGREWGRSSRKTASPKIKNNNTLALAA